MGLHLFFALVFLMPALIIHSCICLTPSGNDTDRLALLSIKAGNPGITSDPFGVMSSWNETIHFCHWLGVTCGHRHQRVTMLDLQSFNLSGFISPQIGNLSFLRTIYLQNNSFSNEIPLEIGHLRRLLDLQLQNNSLSGGIPFNLSSCSQLETIGLSHNFLVGRIPEALGRLSKLRVLIISNNDLTGSLPYSFSNLSSLEILDVGSTYLTGSISDIFGQLTKLEQLVLESSNWSGTLPPSIFNLSSIQRFGVVMNSIEGTLPSNLGVAFPNLEYFDISLNQFSGLIPVSISNASNLGHLAMAGNELQGEVPSLKNLKRLKRFIITSNNLGSGGINDLNFLCDLTNATILRMLGININNFGGTLPHCITNLSSSLAHLHLSDNKIVRRIPNGIGNLANLDSLYLSMNQFSGQIPSDLGNLQHLYVLDLAINSLSGNIPSSFGNLTAINILYFDGNNLQGNIPPSLAECRNLETLVLSENNLTGIIPPELIGQLASAIRLDFSRNQLTGSIPDEVGNLINLEYLNVSENMLFSQIPEALGRCIKIESLDMGRNFFQGTIPSSLGSLRGMQELYLSHNNLSGTIPEFLEQFLFLRSLNLSYNKLEGMVPTKGIFKNASATSVSGNSKLCGGIPEFELPKCKFPHSRKGALSNTLKLIISLACGILGATSALAILYHCVLQREKKQQTSSDTNNFLKLSYQILLKATDGFSSANLIGKGSFGSVFRGVLDQGETTIAVKVLNLVHRAASKSFLAECEALRNIRHRNLLKVLSAYSGVNYQGDDFKALIYEFMVNGSLDEWLHPTQTVAETVERPRNLSFSQRLNIAIDVSMALDYLHHHCVRPIVHCDLKPSNVLLNNDMVGHVGDFGLVRFLPRTSGNQSSSVGVKGTIGYAPPEYGMGNEVWTQGDVYSFGILLLEMFTGRRPTDNMFQGTLNLHNFVREALPKQVREIVDPVLVQENVEAEISLCAWVNIEESLISILEVGVACSAELPRERLDISDAMAEMCRIRTKLHANKM